jgi:hypothetical protein
MFMAFVSVLCNFLSAKQCKKLTTSKEIDMSSLKAKREEKKAAAAAAESSSGSRYSRHKETAVTNVDGIHTIETLFVSLTAS